MSASPQPTVVFLPGLACDARMWPGIADALPAGWQSVVSNVHAEGTSIESMAAAMLAQHAGELVLCGASMGGIIAMEAARQDQQSGHPRICGLALLGTNARPETDDMRRLREGAMTLFEAGRAEEVLQFNLPLAFHPGNASVPALAQAYVRMVLDAGAGQLITQNRAIIHRPDARPHLPPLRCHTLVLCGEADQLTPPECSREIATLIPGARLHVLGQAGHMLTMEQPALVRAHLLSFLADISPGIQGG